MWQRAFKVGFSKKMKLLKKLPRQNNIPCMTSSKAGHLPPPKGPLFCVLLDKHMVLPHVEKVLSRMR